MPKDQWKRIQKRKPRRQCERKIKPQVSSAWARFDRVMSGEIKPSDIEPEPPQKRTQGKITFHGIESNPVHVDRQSYDWPAVTKTSIIREYDPVLYGRSAGTWWPVTVEAAANGIVRDR